MLKWVDVQMSYRKCFQEDTRLYKLSLMVCAGERYYTAHVHHLLHFADSVRNLGPLRAHSAFPFEDTNGWLCDLFHGSRDPQKQVCGYCAHVCGCVCMVHIWMYMFYKCMQTIVIQIVKAFTVRQKLSAAAERVFESVDEGSEAKGFLTHMLCTGHRLAARTWINLGSLRV